MFSLYFGKCFFFLNLIFFKWKVLKFKYILKNRYLYLLVLFIVSWDDGIVRLLD